MAYYVAAILPPFYIDTTEPRDYSNEVRISLFRRHQPLAVLPFFGRRYSNHAIVCIDDDNRPSAAV